MVSTAQGKPSRSAGFWLLSGIDALLLMLALALAGFLYLSGEQEELGAISAGQRLLIAPKTGEISGSMRTSQATPPMGEKPAAEADKLPGSPPTPATPKDTGEALKKKPEFDVADESSASAGAALGNPEGESKIGDTSALVATEDEADTTLQIHPRTAASLAEPIAGLTETTETGALPKSGAEGSPKHYYARPFTVPQPKQPIISILVLDIGMNRALMEQALALPLDVSLAINPYAHDIKQLAENARNLGHETWLMLPSQAGDFPSSDPGPMGLLVGLTPEQLAERLRTVMKSFKGYVGLVLPVDEVFSEQVGLLEPVVKELDERGVAIAAAHVPENHGSADMLQSAKGGLVADVIIDLSLNEAAIQKQLAQIEKIASEKGKVFAVARPYPLTLKLLKPWAASLGAKHITLAPASAIREIE